MDGKPRVLLDLRLYWQAFTDCHAQRSAQWAADPIRIEDIRAWCWLHGIDAPDERRNVATAVLHLDRSWIETQRAKAKR